MFKLRKLLFKGMELGLGLRTTFSFETRNPLFINFRLNTDEARTVQAKLADGFQLSSVRFMESDPEPAFWLSYNFYELKYPSPRLRRITKVRCEVNTFVEAPGGRCGIYVFNPFVSKEQTWSPLGAVCDFAERIVMGIYGCGRLVPMRYDLGSESLGLSLVTDGHSLVTESPFTTTKKEPLSLDYRRFNSFSFFNGAQTYDRVFTDHAFTVAEFERLENLPPGLPLMTTPFFTRIPDAVYVHHGELTYLVDALNQRA